MVLIVAVGSQPILLVVVVMSRYTLLGGDRLDMGTNLILLVRGGRGRTHRSRHDIRFLLACWLRQNKDRAQSIEYTLPSIEQQSLTTRKGETEKLERERYGRSNLVDY